MRLEVAVLDTSPAQAVLLVHRHSAEILENMPALIMVPSEPENSPERVDLETAHEALILTHEAAGEAIQGELTLEACDEIAALLAQAGKELALCRIGLGAR